MHATLTPLRSALLGFALAISGATAHAAAVNKCVVDGKTTYQAEPCENPRDAKAVHLDAGPSADQIRQAQYQSSKAFFAAQTAAREREQGAMKEQYAAAASRQPAKPDCAKLNDAADRARGERTGMLKYSKDMVVTGDAAVADNQRANEVNQRVNSTQQAAAQAGCR